MKKYYKSFIMALSMFTVIPTPYVEWDDEGIKNMMKFYPLVGGIVGLIWSTVYYLLSFLNCSIVLKSAVLLIVPFIVTGMLHLDGFMDVCDAILSRRDKAEKLRILKDSTIGAFAVVSLIMLFFLQFGGMYSILEKDGLSRIFEINSRFNMGSPIYSLLFIPIISRCTAAYFLLTKVTIKESSLGTYFKKGTSIQDIIIMIIALILASILCFISIGWKGILIPVLMAIGITLAVKKCIKEFGGVSGDVAGFALVVGEVIGILTMGIL